MFARPLCSTLLGLLLLAASPMIAEADTAAHQITIENFDFAPMALTIKAGESVTWKNLDEEPHTVTSLTGLFHSGALDEDDSFTYRFDKPGTYAYLCSIHPRMQAVIIVH